METVYFFHTTYTNYTQSSALFCRYLYTVQPTGVHLDNLRSALQLQRPTWCFVFKLANSNDLFFPQQFLPSPLFISFQCIIGIHSFDLNQLLSKFVVFCSCFVFFLSFLIFCESKLLTSGHKVAPTRTN